MTEQQAIKAGLFIVLGLTLVTPAIAGIVIPEAIEDMGDKISARKAAAQKGRLAIAALQPMVREVFEISRFHLVVKVHDSVDAGLTALAQPS